MQTSCPNRGCCLIAANVANARAADANSNRRPSADAPPGFADIARSEFEPKNLAHWPPGIRENDADQASGRQAVAAGRRLLYRGNSRGWTACWIQNRHAYW